MKRKFAALGLAMMAVLVAAAVAVAQTGNGIEVTGNFNPSKAGTKKKPKNTKATVAFTLPDDSHATLNQITYTFPKTVKISGKGFPKCSETTIVQKGDSGCPKKSQVGSGTATALLGTTPLNFTFKIFAGGPKKIALSLKGAVPAVFPGKISGGNKVVVTIPKEVQSPAPGSYSWVTSISSTLSGKVVTKKKNSKKKRKKTHKKFTKTQRNFVGTTGCKSGKQTVGVSLALTENGQPQTLGNPIKGSVDVNCKKAKK